MTRLHGAVESKRRLHERLLFGAKPLRRTHVIHIHAHMYAVGTVDRATQTHNDMSCYLWHGVAHSAHVRNILGHMAALGIPHLNARPDTHTGIVHLLNAGTGRCQSSVQDMEQTDTGIPSTRHCTDTDPHSHMHHADHRAKGSAWN